MNVFKKKLHLTIRFILLLFLQSNFLKANPEDSASSKTITGSVTGATSLSSLTAILSGDNGLYDVSVQNNGFFEFNNIPYGEYSLKINGDGYDTGESKEIIVSSNSPSESLSFPISALTDSGFQFSWTDDSTPGGSEISSYINKPIEVEILGQKESIGKGAYAQRLWRDYSILLQNEEIAWNQEHGYRLLKTIDSIFLEYWDKLSVSKWILSEDQIAEDILITKDGDITKIEISKHAFTNADPLIAKVEGKRGVYFSNRLHHACIRYITEEGTNTGRVSRLLQKRYGVSIRYLDYESITQLTTGETGDRFEEFYPEELLRIINMFEEMPEGFRKIPNLKYLLRRKTGQSHPLYPEAPAVAWTSLDDGYIEFMDSGFDTNSLDYLHRLILHEKAHFIYASLLTDSLKKKWNEVGGWYENPDDPEGWSTTKTTEFVSAYAHGKNPDEDFAESVSYFIVNPDKLRSRSLPKYEFIRDYIMQGSIYISRIREDLTFEVLNLYPDYDYPGKIKSVSTKVSGGPEEDKEITIRVNIHTLEGVLDSAKWGRLRLTSSLGTYEDLYLYPVDENGQSKEMSHILEGKTVLSKHVKAGFWTTDQITISDQAGNERHSGVDDFGWKLYLDNPLEDVVAPKYIADSISTYLVNDTIDGEAVQILQVSWDVEENVRMASWANCLVTIRPPGEDAYRLQEWGYGIDDGDDGYNSQTKKCRVDFIITDSFRTGVYEIREIILADEAMNRSTTKFSEQTGDEPPVFVSIETSNEDVTPPELDLNNILISARPTNPDKPNGETIVNIDYKVRDDISGLGTVAYYLRDPQGLEHHHYHYHDNFHTDFFVGDPTVWSTYNASVVLPVGSAPGTWGLAEIYLQDKARNFKIYNFTEIVRFVLSNSGTVDEGVSEGFSELTISNTEIYGRQQKGSIIANIASNYIGKLNSGISYDLVGGTGSNDNTLFSLSSLGSLSVKSEFHFDIDKELAIRVRATADNNESLEKSFLLKFIAPDPNDPTAQLEFSQFGSVSGNVTDGSGNWLEEFDVWFFKVPEPGQDLYSGEPAFFDLERGADGSFVASLPPGSYHAEAFAYDFKTDTPYRPQLAGGFKSPTVFTIVDGDTNITTVDEPSLNFSLEAEYRMSHEFAEVEGTVTVAGRDEVDHVFFDLFPVVDGVRQTDYPVYSFGLERGGKIRGEAPVGEFVLEVFSPDNSLYMDSVLTITIEPNKKNELDPIELIERAMVTVRGSIKDSSNNPIWAEIVFVDPNDDDNRFWPMWDETATGLSDGDFALKIPQGDYKILAERFDGMYKSAFYDGDNNGTADTVSIASNITGIDFVLESRPTATVTIKLLDANTSEPVKYAWFDFFDAEDEYAPIVFPHLGMIDFESDTFDGTYTLSVPGGSYKLELASPEYKEVYQILDESGNTAWETSEWENGATITLTDGNTTDLGTVNLEATGFSDAEFYGFGWLDEGEDLSGGATITGTVKTSSGIGVPKARIIAHTVDYIFWFDHVQTRSDGSYELKNLPDGEWVVFAEPPFDSESFQGFRESNQTVVSLGDGDTETVNHVLQGSNVFGRIMFPKKNHATGETKNEGLGHAFVWAFRDEDQDGEPDWDDDILAGTAMLTEAFGETDKNGFFSFYLEEGGKYSIRIDIPGQLSALAPAPIGFTLKNPNESMKLGNAIKIDWKSDVRATAFDVERKSETESSYKSLFLDANTTTKPGGQAKSFVDPTVKPGEKYNYRVVAETANGQVTLESSKVRVSEPIIYLAPPSKKITGYVLDGDNTAIAGAEVVAWREEGEGWSSTFTGDDGSYELTAGPGKWEITIYRPYDRKVDWVYDAAPKRVKFAPGSKIESKTKNFTVSRMAGGKIIGSINLPTGVSASDLSTYVYIDAFDPEGRGNWGQPESDGSFEIPLQPGEYELSLWIDPALQGYGSPAIKMVRVGKNSVNVGDLDLTSRNKTLSGVVKTTTGTALPNVHVWGWSDQGGWVSDTTNINGEYSLAVSPGRWEVGYDLPANEDGSLPPYFVTPPKRLRIKDNDTTKTLDLYVQAAAATVSGVVYGPNGGPVSDLNSWVYAREFTSNDEEYTDILAEVPLTSKGTFTFPGLPGEYMVGLWMPPGSTYGYAGEKYYKVEVVDGATVLKDSNGTVVTQASFNLLQNDSTVKGSFKLSGQAVTGLTGEVYAIRVDGDGWQSTAIEDNGTYEMILAAGNWALDYYIESDASDRNIPRYPSEPVVVRARQSATLVQDFTLATASASIAGKVVYESNSSAVKESSLYVWAYREGRGNLKEHWNEVETDENGTFTIPVLPGGRYEVGAILSQELREQGYLDSLVVKANLSSGSVSDLNLTITKPSTENFIAGTILDPNGNAVEDAIVYAWSDDGREAYVETDANGSYSLLVPNGSVWHVGAEYAEIDANGSETYFSTDYEVDVNLKSAASKGGLSLNLTAPDFEIPDGTSVTFDPTKDFVTQLPDGTELTIPGGAANVDSTVTEVRIVITPTAKGLSKSADEKPADYGYSIELFDNKGKKVEGNFKKDVILSIPVDVNASIAKGMDINNVEAMYYSTTKDAWDKAKTSTWDKNSSTLTMTTDHFTTFAAVSTPDISEISSGLAKIDDGTKGDWYTLDWLGYFYDASGGWIYHVELGWLYAQEGENGNYWLYDSNLGWLWTGPTYFDSTQSDKAYLYSVSESGWLYFEYSGGERKFYSYTNSNWSTPGQ